MIRVILTSVAEGIIKRFSGIGRGEETIDDREAFEHYGFTSRPLPGAEGVVIRDGNHFIMIASDDRRYRLAIAAGEVALYDSQGQKVHLKGDGTIEVIGTNKTTVTAPLVEVVASSQVTMTTPLLAVSGNITSGGNITATGEVADAGGAKTMSGMRATYNGHHHSTGPAPTEQM